ncbi:MAG TPA: hypothetical protein VF718_12205 [Allosphingosinicella sp.]|jgi:hypothetical protein
MKMTMIAALAAAQLAVAVPAQAADMPREEAAANPISDGRVGDVVPQQQAAALVTAAGPESTRAPTAREDRPRKRKSTGDKVLTGAAVVLGIGALAVGGLLVAIFVN